MTPRRDWDTVPKGPNAARTQLVPNIAAVELASGPAQPVVPSSNPGLVNRFWEKRGAPEKKSMVERIPDSTLPNRLGFATPERSIENMILLPVAQSRGGQIQQVE